MVGNYNLLKMDSKNVKYKKTLSISFKKNSEPPVAGFEGKAGNWIVGRFEKIGEDKQGVIWNLTEGSATLMGIHGEEAKEEDIYFDRLFNLKYILFKNDNRDLTIKTKKPNESLIFKKVNDTIQ